MMLDLTYHVTQTPTTGRADPRMAGGGAQRLAKSRYDAISCYIYSCQSARSASFSDLSQQSGVGPGAGSGSGLSPRATPRSASGGGGMWGGGDEVLNAYNDVPVEVDEGLEALMLERGLDPILARHVVRRARGVCGLKERTGSRFDLI